MALLSLLSIGAQPEVVVLLTLVAVCYTLVYYFGKRSQIPLPPQPKGWPVVGNLPEFMKAAERGQMHLLVQDWANTFGDVLRVKLGPTTLYYLSSDVAVKTLLEKSSAYSSDRPRWILSSELLSNLWNVLLLNSSSQTWKNHRRIGHSELASIPMADEGLPPLYYETLQFLHEIAQDPNTGAASQDLWTSIGRYTYSNFATQAIGFAIPSGQDPDIQYIHESGLRAIVGTLPGSNIIDILPILDYLPLWLKPWERKARAHFTNDLEWCRNKMREMQRTQGSDQNSMLARVLSDEKLLGLSCEDEAAYLSLSYIIGAADTSRMSTWSFLEAMMHFPSVQRQGQIEVDRVCGDQLPVWEDFNKSPLFRCIMKEVWRWRPPVALGHPHFTTREMVYNGVRIPKGSRLHINAWNISRDPKRHEQPDRFWPERYIGDEMSSLQSANQADPKKRDHYAFGAGRRMCVGIHVAERSLGVAIMRILWACDVGIRKDATVPLDPKDYASAIPGNSGERLPVTLTMRSEEKKRLIEKAWEEASSYGERRA